VEAQGYAGYVADVWVGDDLEASWDPWATTVRFLAGVRDREQAYATHARLVDYGDAEAGACSVVTGRCANPWTPQNVYDAAWGSGWAAPLPEAYTPDGTEHWLDVAAAAQGVQGTMVFLGAMTECAGADPLPVGACVPQKGPPSDAQPDGLTGSGACEWSP